MNARLFVLLGTVFTALLGQAQEQPDLQQLERIIAVVGNEIVLQSDVDA